MAQTVEDEFLGDSKARMWTFVILGALLLVGVLVAQAAWENPEQARAALDGLLGLPGWAHAAITGGLGLVIFYLGLKVETDWPEALGAAMISGSFLALEIMVGLEHFEFGGLTLLPFVLPLLIFTVFFGVGLSKSK